MFQWLENYQLNSFLEVGRDVYRVSQKCILLCIIINSSKLNLKRNKPQLSYQLLKVYAFLGHPVCMYI